MKKIIKVEASELAKYRREIKAATALERRAKARREQWGLPEASAETVGEYILADGNGQPVAVYTVAARKGYVVKDGFSGRLS